MYYKTNLICPHCGSSLYADKTYRCHHCEKEYTTEILMDIYHFRSAHTDIYYDPDMDAVVLEYFYEKVSDFVKIKELWPKESTNHSIICESTNEFKNLMYLNSIAGIEKIKGYQEVITCFEELKNIKQTQRVQGLYVTYTNLKQKNFCIEIPTITKQTIHGGKTVEWQKVAEALRGTSMIHAHCEGNNTVCRFLKVPDCDQLEEIQERVAPYVRSVSVEEILEEARKI